VNILFIGDIVGRPGRHTVKALLPKLKADYAIDFIIANGENTAGGFGITKKLTEELLGSGIDVITTGNHVWANKEVINFLGNEKMLLRPANYPPEAPGEGSRVYQCQFGNDVKVGVINLCGRTFMESLDCPFRVAIKEVDKISAQTKIIVVDFHAEATSEKLAMGWFLDGKVSAVIGTHTHVQTADERISPNGTAYITDVGMTGPFDSILGLDKDLIIRRFLTQMPQKFEVASGESILCGVYFQVNEQDGKAQKIVRIEEHL